MRQHPGRVNIFAGRGRPAAALSIAVALAAVLSACASATLPGGSDVSAPTGAVRAPASFGHIHNILWDGDALLLGTHRGLWRQEVGSEPRQVSEDPFDVMGLAGSPPTLLASGHPGPGQDAPGNLGLIESTDGGRAWVPLSLQGEADFHRLVQSGQTVLGINSGDGTLQRSQDGGRSWTTIGSEPLYDIALDPGQPSTVLATTETGLRRSQDGGTRFADVPGAPGLVLLAWAGTGTYGVAPDGSVYVSRDSGSTWKAAGSVSAPPMAIAASGDRVAVVIGGSVVASADGGRTFSQRIVGLPAGH